MDPTKRWQSGEFTDLVIVGIGGSDLGPRAIYLALQGFKKEVPKRFLLSLSFFCVLLHSCDDSNIATHKITLGCAPSTLLSRVSRRRYAHSISSLQDSGCRVQGAGCRVQGAGKHVLRGGFCGMVPRCRC